MYTIRFFHQVTYSYTWPNCLLIIYFKIRVYLYKHYTSGSESSDYSLKQTVCIASALICLQLVSTMHTELYLFVLAVKVKVQKIFFCDNL